MKRLMRTTAMAAGLIAAAALLTACPAIAPPATQESFTQFVKDLIRQTADDTEPVDIADKDFAFDENEDAFSDILAEFPNGVAVQTIDESQ